MILENIIIGLKFLEKMRGLGGCRFFWEVKGHRGMGLYGPKGLFNELNLINCLSFLSDNYNFYDNIHIYIFF